MIGPALQRADAERGARFFFNASEIHQISDFTEIEGFSGARLWRMETSLGPFCLKAWPQSSMPASRLSQVHALLHKAHLAGLTFVPRVFARENRTLLEQAGVVWDLTTWMPGKTDFENHPSPGRLQSAIVALAQLHATWFESRQPRMPCPAVLRRLQAAKEWSDLLHQGWSPRWDAVPSPVRDLLQLAWPGLQQPMPRLGELQYWATQPVAVQPCHCDVWHDNLLFEGDALSGLLDFGSVKLDHVAADLSRLLGSLAADHPKLYEEGLETYRRRRGLSWEEEGLVRLLDEAGRWVSLMNWVRWLCLEGRAYRSWERVERRIRRLIVK